MRLFQTRSLKVFTNHSSGYTRRLKSIWRRIWQLPFLLKKADLVICPSLPRVEVTKTCYRGPIECIPNVVNTEEFQPRNKDAELLNELGLSTKIGLLQPQFERSMLRASINSQRGQYSPPCPKLGFTYLR